MQKSRNILICGANNVVEHYGKLIEILDGCTFIYSEKATKFCKISALLLSVCAVNKSKVEISQNFAAFSRLYSKNTIWMK